MAGTLMTPEEFDAIQAWVPGWRYELIHGALVVSPLPREGEADPNEELGRWLRNYQEGHPEGKQRRRVRVEAEGGPPAGLSGETRRIHSDRGFRVLDHRPLSSDYDRDPQPAGRAGGNSRSRE